MIASLKAKLRPFLAVTALIFIVYAARDLYERWDGTRVEVDLRFFALACATAAGAMIFQFLAWRTLIHKWSTAAMPFWASGRLYLDSQMARYTPGKIGLPAVRILGAAKVGVAPGVMGATLMVELLSWCSVGTLLGTVLLALVPAAKGVLGALSQGAIAIAIGSALALIVLLVLSVEHLPSRLAALLGPAHKGALVPLRLPLWHLLHFGAWVLCGAFLCRSVGGTWEQAPIAGAVLCIAVVAGFLALFAPAGAGVREAVISLALTPLLGPTAALSLGLLARVTSLLSDVLLWGLFRLMASDRSQSR